MLIKIFEDFDVRVGGALLVKSKPYEDDMCRLYLTRVISYKEYPVKKGYPKIVAQIDINAFYFLKEINSTIIGHKIDNITFEELYKYFNMRSDKLYLKDSKTPMWSISTEMSPMNFLTKYNSSIKDLKDIAFY
jgi:hypothetical protein